MKQSRFFLIFAAMVLAQALASGCLNLSRFIMLSILPSLIVCLPLKWRPWFGVLLAFVAGLAVDFLGTGMLGLSSMALMPVALLRDRFFELLFGDEVFARSEDVPLSRQSGGKVFIVTALSSALYMLVAVWAEAAGTCPFGFLLLRWALSTAVSALVGYFVVNLLFSDKR